MANAIVKRGLVPVGTVSGQVYTGAVRQYTIPASDGTATFIGDAIIQLGTVSVVNGATMLDCKQAATGDVLTGVIVGFAPDTSTSAPYRLASTLRVAFVADDPNILFEIGDISTGTPLTAADVGLNVNFVVGTGSTVTGYSAFELDNSSEATTNTLDLKIIGMVNRPDNADGTSSVRYLVRLNRHRFVNQLAGV